MNKKTILICIVCVFILVGQTSLSKANYIESTDNDPSTFNTNKNIYGAAVNQSNGGSWPSAISGDGRYIAFESEASNLVIGDTNNREDIFVYDRLTGQTKRVSVASDGSEGNFESKEPCISSDGRYVGFRSAARNLLGYPTQSGGNYIHDNFTGRTDIVSIDNDGTYFIGGVGGCSISADGQYISFASMAKRSLYYVPNYYLKVFLHNYLTGNTLLVSVASDGSPGLGHSYNNSISSDGRYILFDSYADNLVSGDTNISLDVFLHDTHDGETIRVSLASDGSQGNYFSTFQLSGNTISSNGNLITFSSYASNLVFGDSNGDEDVFLHNVLTGETTRISVASDGTQGNYSSRYPSISTDGRNITFTSVSNNLVSGDTNNSLDVFLHDTQTHKTTRVSLSSTGIQGNNGSFASSISADGRFVSFSSAASNLVPGDTNGYEDVFLHDILTGETILVSKSLYASISFPQPVILVHGWQGLKSGYHCTDGIDFYNGSDSSLSTLGPMSDWFVGQGYQVWIAHLESTPLGTPSLEENAKCLRDQIEYVASLNPNPITIVAHSMGGVVSRAAIGNLGSAKIKALYTLGSPHAGLPLDVIFGTPLELICSVQEGACNMAISSMMDNFNPAHPNIKNISYNFIGGDGGTGIKDYLLTKFNQGPNDGLIGQYSAVGWVYPSTNFVPDWAGSSDPGQYWTDEVHTDSFSGFAYYEARDTEDNDWSRAFQCILDLMEDGVHTTDKCEKVDGSIQAFTQSDLESASTTISAISQIQTGNLADGGSASIPLQVDAAGETLFNLSWSSGDFEFTLTRPDATAIDPAYAVANPSEVSYESWEGSPESYPSKVYHFSNAMAGEWQLNISATSAGDYWAYAMLTSPYSLEADTDQDSYAMGGTATITATLEKNAVGLSGQSVTATITKQDGIVSTVALTDQNDGTYTNTYLIPAIPGYLRLSVDADGDNAGTLFTRHTSLQVTAQPEDATYTGTYTETGDDTNLDGLYETLDFDIEINAVKAGDYALSADLYAGDQFVAHAGDFYTLASGTQSVTLPFNGTTIRNAGLNGPYSFTNVFLIPLDLGLLTASADDVLATAAYDYTDFGICYALTVNFAGSGNTPTTTPVNSTGCFAGEYTEGELINLTAAPDTGWKVDSWIGTDDDTSIALTNAVTMPASIYSLAVNYSDLEPTVSSITRADVNPTQASSIDFSVIFSEPVTGVDPSDFSLTTTGDVSGTSVSAVSGSDDTYTITVDTGTGEGTIRLDLNDSGTYIQDTAGNLISGGYTAGEVYTIEYHPEIDLQGNGLSIVAGYATPSVTNDTDFGEAEVGVNTVAHTFTVENSGGDELNLSGTPKVEITGTHADDFTVTSFPTSPVASGGGTTTFEITFDPSAEGVREANISIANDDSDENPYTFAIKGTGTTAALEADFIGMYSRTQKTWYLKDANTDGWSNVQTVRFGSTLSSWLPVEGDWNGDGSDTIGMYSRTQKTWYLKDANDDGWANVSTVRFGSVDSSWIPVVGDWDDDGTDEIGMYSRTQKTWYLKDANTDGWANVSTVRFGSTLTSWIPVLGDWNEDGTDTIGMYSRTQKTWYLKDANTDGWGEVTTVRFGSTDSNWIPVVGDWNGNGTDTMAMYSRTQKTWYLKDADTDGWGDVTTVRFGSTDSSWLPVTGKW